MAYMPAHSRGNVQAAPTHQLCAPGKVRVLAIGEEFHVEKFAIERNILHHLAAEKGGSSGRAKYVFHSIVLSAIFDLAAAIEMTQVAAEIHARGINDAAELLIGAGPPSQQLAAHRAEPGIRLTRPYQLRNEIGLQHHVRVQAKEPFALGMLESQVLRRRKAGILVIENDLVRRAKRREYFAGRVARRVINNDDFNGSVLLLGEGAQAAGQHLGAVIRADEDGNHSGERGFSGCTRGYDRIAPGCDLPIFIIETTKAMRILLIGAAGQLAQDLLEHLRAHDVVPLAHEQLEIADADAVREAVERARPDCIINTAAFHKVDECEDQPERSFQVNAVGVYNLAREAERRAARLVHFSTDYVFDGRSKVPYQEEDRPGPLSVYASSKLAGEGLAQRYCERHFVVRTCGLYGDAGNRSKGGNFVERMLGLARSGKPLRVVADQVLTPTSTRDLGERVASLLQSDAYGLYHMTSTGQCSWYEFTQEIFRLANVAADLRPADSASFGAKARRPPYSVLDNARMRRLGITEFRPWQEAIADYMHRRKRLAAG